MTRGEIPLLVALLVGVSLTGCASPDQIHQIHILPYRGDIAVASVVQISDGDFDGLPSKWLDGFRAAAATGEATVAASDVEKDQFDEHMRPRVEAAQGSGARVVWLFQGKHYSMAMLG